MPKNKIGTANFSLFKKKNLPLVAKLRTMDYGAQLSAEDIGKLSQEELELYEDYLEHVWSKK